VNLERENGIVASAAGLPLGDAAFLRAVLEAIPAFVVRVDPEQRISYINHLRGGLTLEQVMGRPVREFIAPDDFEAYERALERAFHTGKPSTYMAKGVHSVTDAGLASYACEVVPIDHGDGRRAACIVATDVTDRRITEERLRNAQKLDTVGSLTAGVAHNFNNMLAVILPVLEASHGSAMSPLKELTEDALHAARRARDLVWQLMTFAGQQRRTSSPQDPSSIVERAVSMCRRTFERQVHIDAGLVEAGSRIVCDPTSIEQMLVNLLINARDAVTDAERDAPCITVDLSDDCELPDDAPEPQDGRSYVRIRIRDNGMGMTDAVKQRVFEPFFTTKAPGTGTGLGLATSYVIARDHGGFITLESEYGIGTTFSVFLPSALGEGDVSRSSPPPSARTLRLGKILLIEDEAAVRRVAYSLLRARGHEVRTADDGEMAVQILDSGFVPNLVLLDRSLPGWSAATTLLELRKRVGPTPVLLFTGRAPTDEERKEVQGVLTKPLSTDELLHSVERWLPAGAERAADKN
jgi:two-component system cell cycle sensor histidine kinase/response regulator CckA